MVFKMSDKKPKRAQGNLDCFFSKKSKTEFKSVSTLRIQTISFINHTMFIIILKFIGIAGKL